MSLRASLFGFGVAALAMSSSLAAQGIQRWDAGLNLVLPLDGLKSVTQQNGISGGFIAEVGFNGHLIDTTVPFRVTLAANVLPGTEKDGTKTSLLGYQLASDLFTETGVRNLSLVTGVSLNRWKAKVEDTTVNETTTVKGIKFGGRIGVEYQITPAFSANVLLQVIELGTDAQATKGVNPSWVQVGAKYHF